MSQDILRQIRAARTAALAVAQPEMAGIIVTGGDRVTWLNGLVTCDLAKRADGEARYGLVVARNGRVLTDVSVVVDAEQVFVLLPRTVSAAIKEHLDHYLVMEDAVLADVGPGEIWAIHGPRSHELLAAAQAAGAVGGMLDRTGLGGAVVVATPSVVAVVRGAVERGAAAAGGLIGDEAGWEALRLERGVARFSVDFDETMYPQEASLEKVAVSFEKGCYLGQEVVCMLQMRGHAKRRLVPLVIADGAAPVRGAVVTDGAGAVVGEITSAAASPTLGKPVALAMVKRAHAELGQQLLLGGTARAEVVERPA
jgi:tRNA-modifying protein YgfZ